MLKINRDVNFDPTDIESIFDTSMYGYFELRHKLDDVIFIIIDKS